jgi:hypothetical protein
MDGHRRHRRLRCSFAARCSSAPGWTGGRYSWDHSSGARCNWVSAARYTPAPDSNAIHQNWAADCRPERCCAAHRRPEGYCVAPRRPERCSVAHRRPEGYSVAPRRSERCSVAHWPGAPIRDCRSAASRWNPAAAYSAGLPPERCRRGRCWVRFADQPAALHSIRQARQSASSHCRRRPDGCYSRFPPAAAWRLPKGCRPIQKYVRPRAGSPGSRRFAAGRTEFAARPQAADA